MTFDPITHGLESHYSPEQHDRLRRLMLEDWKDAGIKLPTYMKLIARHIEKTGAPEHWLTKLRHQTMDNMLKRVFVPRYEFWACLHMYLNKKYGAIDLGGAFNEDDMLGAALVRYGRAQAAPKANQYQIEDTVIEVKSASDKNYAYAEVVTPEKEIPEFTLDIVHPVKGVAIQQGEKITAIMRNVITYKISAIELI